MVASGEASEPSSPKTEKISRLFERTRLFNGRNETLFEGWDVFQVFPANTLLELAESLPSSRLGDRVVALGELLLIRSSSLFERRW